MANIGRPKATVVVTDVERRELVRLTKRAHVNRALAFRDRLVLACAEDATDTAVARRQRTTNATVGLVMSLEQGDVVAIFPEGGVWKKRDPPVGEFAPDV